MAFWSHLCHFIALAFAAEAMGAYTHELNTGLAVLALILGVCLDPTGRVGGVVRRGSRWWMGLLTAATGLGALPLVGDMRACAAAVWFAGLAVMAEARGRPAAPRIQWAVAALLFGLFEYARTNCLPVWYRIERVSEGFSALGENLADAPLALGPTFSGLSLAALAASVAIASLCSSRTRRATMCGVIALGLIPILWLGYLAAFARAPGRLPEANGPSFSLIAPTPSVLWHFLYPLRMQTILAILLGVTTSVCISMAAIDRRGDVPPTGGRSTARRLMVVVALLIAVVGPWRLALQPIPIKVGRLNVALYERGFLNWLVPDKQRYGSRQVGMFGLLPRLVECMGGRATMLPDISAAALADQDVLVIINQEERLSRDSLRAVLDFVRRGGGLLVLGDHTSWKQGTDVPQKIHPLDLALNDPIREAGIRFRFDTAEFFIGGWLHSHQFWPHPITANVRDETNAAGIVVGASLEVYPPAVPLVVGRYGYAVPGTPKFDAQRGYMGPREYTPGDRLGDVVLAAADRVGDGRIVVIGDTSGFVNAIQTQTWPFNRAVIEWLAWGGAAGAAYAWQTAGCIGLMILGGLVLWLRRPWVIAGVAAALLVSGGYIRMRAASSLPATPLSGKVAAVDLSHIGLHSLEGWREDGVLGLTMNLVRSGYFAVGMSDFDSRQIEKSDLIVTIAPTRPYSMDELTSLRKYLDGGGTLLLAVGWEERAGAASLLDEFGLRLLHHPLGRAEVSVPGTTLHPMFWSAWPVTGGDAILTHEDQPIVTRQRVGKGQLVVLGDSEFLLNKNLETEDGAIMRNVEFFYWLIDRLREGGGT